jgi:hypothetical protein
MTKDTQSRWDEFERRCVPSSVGPMPRKTLRLAFCAGMLALRDAYIEEAMQPRETRIAAVDAMNADLDAFAESVLADAKEVFHG